MKQLCGLSALIAVAACQPAPDKAAASQTAIPSAENAGNGLAQAGVAPAVKDGVAAGAGVACAANEQPVFSCKLANGKHLAVCAAPAGKVEYRYGSDRPELVLSGGEWSNTAYSGGGESQIRFANGDTSYIIFSRIVRTNFAADEPNDPAISDGVIVLRGTKAVSVQTCDDPDMMPIQYDLAERVLPLADDLFTYETERAD